MTKAIAFDLDDTLLDTTFMLTPKASEDTFKFMIANDLNLTTAECEEKRRNWVATMSHREIFEKLAVDYGTEKTRQITQTAVDMFYNYPLPTRLPLLNGAQKNLDYLRHKYALYLVTAGIEKSQLDKVAALGISPYFKKIYVVDSILKKRKADAFKQILELENIPPEQLLCIGNSLLSEIKDALLMGAQACYFEYGEVRGSLQDLPREPHYTLSRHTELIAKCQL